MQFFPNSRCKIGAIKNTAILEIFFFNSKFGLEVMWTIQGLITGKSNQIIIHLTE